MNSFVKDFSQDKIQSDEKLIRDYFANNGIMFEGKALPFEVRPYLMSQEKDSRVQKGFKTFYQLLEKIIDLYNSHEEIRDFFGYEKVVDQLIRQDQGYKAHIHLARFDYTFDVEGQPKIYETNSECPGGLLLMRKIFQGYQKTEIFRHLKFHLPEQMNTYPHYEGPVFGNSLLEVARENIRNRSSNQIFDFAIFNSQSNTMTNEVSLMVEELQNLGHRCSTDYVERTMLLNGRLTSQGRPIDLCYQKFDYNNGQEIPFTYDPDLVQDYLEAIKEKKVLALNSFASSYLIENKLVLAMFWEPKLSCYFSEEELSFARKICVPTHKVSTMTTVELDKIRLNKENFVIKKGLDTRGRSVILGKNVCPQVWQNALEEAFKSPTEAFVVQDFVPHEIILNFCGQNFISHAYFLLCGKPIGPLTRYSSSEITNVGQRGALGICFRGSAAEPEGFHE